MKATARILDANTLLKTASRFMRFPILLLIVLQVSGCVMMAVEAGRSMYPTYGEVTKQWATPGQNRGRVVIYMPAQSVGGAIKDSVFVNAVVQVDGGQKLLLMTGTFIYADLPAGTHNIEVLYPAFKSPALRGLGGVVCKVGKNFSVNVADGSTSYVRITYQSSANPFADVGPDNYSIAEVALNVAAQELSALHHNYKKAQPFNASKESRGSSWGGEPACP